MTPNVKWKKTQISNNLYQTEKDYSKDSRYLEMKSD